MGLLSDISSGIGGMVGGYQGAKREEEFMKEAMEAQRRALKGMMLLQGQGMAASEEQFGAALAELDAVGPAMRQELLARGEQDVAAATQSALGTGLTGTSAFQSGMLRASRMDTQRQLGQLEERLAGSRAQLRAGRGTELYGQYLDRANIRQRTKYDPFLQNYAPGQMTAAGAQAGAGMADMAGVLFSFFGGGLF